MMNVGGVGGLQIFECPNCSLCELLCVGRGCAGGLGLLAFICMHYWGRGAMYVGIVGVVSKILYRES